MNTDANLRDGFVEVEFKAISGREDQAAGLVWRARDADNYFIARATACADNVHIYHTVNGRRVQFAGVDGSDKMLTRVLGELPALFFVRKIGERLHSVQSIAPRVLSPHQIQHLRLNLDSAVET